MFDAESSEFCIYTQKPHPHLHSSNICCDGMIRQEAAKKKILAVCCCENIDQLLCLRKKRLRMAKSQDFNSTPSSDFAEACRREKINRWAASIERKQKRNGRCIYVKCAQISGDSYRADSCLSANV